MAVKPASIPEWAINDVIDGTSGQNNVVEPSGAQKDIGWDFKQKPPRQFFNWLQRFNHLWIQYLDDSIDQELNTDTLGVQFGTLNVINPAQTNARHNLTFDGSENAIINMLDATGSANVQLKTIGESSILNGIDIGTSLKVGTTKFVVTASTGNTVTQGTLGSIGNFAVGAAKFSVVAATGNTIVKGTLTADGNLDIGSAVFVLNPTTGLMAIDSSGATANVIEVDDGIGVKYSVSKDGDLACIDIGCSAISAIGNIFVETNKIQLIASSGNINASGNIISGGTLDTTNGEIRVENSVGTMFAEMIANGAGTFKDSSVNANSSLSCVGDAFFGNSTTEKIIIKGPSGRIDINSQTLQTISGESLTSYFIMQVAGVDVKVAVVV